MVLNWLRLLVVMVTIVLVEYGASASSSDSCVNIVPYFRHLTYGLKIFDVDPLPPNNLNQRGLAPLFVQSCSGNRTTDVPTIPNFYFQIPDSVVELKAELLDPPINESYNYDNPIDYRDKLVARFGLDMRHYGGPYSPTTNYVKTKEGIERDDTYVIENSQRYSSLRVKLNPYMPTTTEFDRALEKLPAKFEDSKSVAEYDALIDTFGTHYIEYFELGDFFYQKVTIDGDYMDRNELSEVEPNADIMFYRQMGRLGYTAWNENAIKQLVPTDGFIRHSKIEFDYYGGKKGLLLELLDDKSRIAEWKRQLLTNPALVKAETEPISKLVINKATRLQVEKALRYRCLKEYIRNAVNYVYLHPQLKSYDTPTVDRIHDNLLNAESSPSFNSSKNFDLLIEHLKEIESIKDQLVFRTYLAKMNDLNTFIRCRWTIASKTEKSNLPFYERVHEEWHVFGIYMKELEDMVSSRATSLVSTPRIRKIQEFIQTTRRSRDNFCSWVKTERDVIE